MIVKGDCTFTRVGFWGCVFQQMQIDLTKPLSPVVTALCLQLPVVLIEQLMAGRYWELMLECADLNCVSCLVIYFIDPQDVCMTRHDAVMRPQVAGLVQMERILLLEFAERFFFTCPVPAVVHDRIPDEM